MGDYQLSLQGGSYNPLARLEASQQKVSSGSTASSDGSSRGKKSRSNSPSHAFGFFQSKRVASQQNLEGLQQAIPPRHSTACCDGLSERREVERRLSSQKMKVCPGDSENGDSFRSEDSESLALWEEKEPASTDHGWMKLTTQSPRWLEAMRRFGRSYPVHPKSSRDTPRVSLDRKSSQRSLQDTSKSWYSNATKKIRNGESRSVRSPAGASIRQSGELLHPSKWDPECGDTSGDSKHGSFSRLTEEDTRFAASAVAWDISLQPEALVEKARPVNGLLWEIPVDGLPEMAEGEKFVDANSVKTKDAHSVTDKLVESSLSEGDLSNASNEGCCESFFDGQSEYASCRTFAEDELLESDVRLCKDKKSTDEDSAEFVNVIDFVAPLLTKLHSMERKDDATAIARTKSCERRVSFKWEAPQGKQHRADEVAQPPPFVTKDGASSQYESLREQYIMKSKSAPLDGLYVIAPKTSLSGITKPRPPRAPTSTITEDYVTADSFLTKSRSTNDAGGPLRRVPNSPDHRLLTKLRKSVFGATRGPSPLGLKNDLGDFMDCSSPRSILRGPDEGSVPSSNPSLRSDPGTPAFSAIPTSSASQSISSCSASFDLNDSGEYEMTYDLSNSTAASIIVESRRVSLSFRDFGPAPPSGEDMAVIVEDASENVTSNIELLGCDDRFDTNGLRSLPETMQSPELWTATFSTRFHVCDSPRSDMPESPCAATERATEVSAEFAAPAPVSRATYEVPSEDQQVQVPIVIQKSTSRNGSEFTARLGVMFSPFRLISSHESNHSCFVAATLSPPREVDDEDQSPTYSATLEFLSTSELHSSSTKERKAKSSWINSEKVKPKSSTRRHSSEDSHTMMVSISKAMKKILSKCTVKRSTSKGKSKIGSRVLDALPPAAFHFAEVK